MLGGAEAETAHEVIFKILCDKSESNKAQAIREYLIENPNVISLDLKKKQIGNEGAGVLGEGLKGRNVTSLRLICNSISDEGVKSFVKGLKTFSNLTSLDLAYNDIGSQGASYLVGFKDTTLSHINLYENPIGDQGIVDLVRGLISGSNMTSFIFGKNKIKDYGVITVLADLIKDTNVTTFSFNDGCSYQSLNLLKTTVAENRERIANERKSAYLLIKQYAVNRLSESQIASGGIHFPKLDDLDSVEYANAEIQYANGILLDGYIKENSALHTKSTITSSQ